MTTAFIPPPAISREARDEIARLYNEGLIFPQEYQHIVHAHRKAEKESQENLQTPDRIPDVYDAYAHRHDPSYWAHPRLYDANGTALDTMCLVEFARKFCVPRKGPHAGRIKYHRHGVITKKIQFHPEYSSDPTFEGGRDYGKYCRFALVRYRPWIDAPFGRRVENNNGKLTVKANSPKDEDCIWQWKEFLLELRERMHLIPDVLLPEELKGGGAGIELLVVPTVEQRTEEAEEDDNSQRNTYDKEKETDNINLDDEDETEDEDISVCLSYAMEYSDMEAGTDEGVEDTGTSDIQKHSIDTSNTKSGQTFETASTSSFSDESFVQSPWEEAASFGEEAFDAASFAQSSSCFAHSVPSDGTSAVTWSVGSDPDQENADNLEQKEDNLFSEWTSSWDNIGDVDFPTIDDIDRRNAWDTSTAAFFAAPPTSPARKLAPSRRDLTSSACRASPCRNGKKKLPAEYVFEKAEAIDRTYQGDVSRVYEKLQGKVRRQRS